MNKLNGRLARLEAAIKPAADVGRIIICDLTDDPNEAEAARRLADARAAAGPSGTVIEVLCDGYRDPRAGRVVGLSWDDV